MNLHNMGVEDMCHGRQEVGINLKRRFFLGSGRKTVKRRTMTVIAAFTSSSCPKDLDKKLQPNPYRRKMHWRRTYATFVKELVQVTLSPSIYLTHLIYGGSIQHFTSFQTKKCPRTSKHTQLLATFSGMILHGLSMCM